MTVGSARALLGGGGLVALALVARLCDGMLARFGIAGMHRAVILTLFVVLMSQRVLYLFTTFLGIMAMITRARPKGLVWPDELTLVSGLNKRPAIVCPIKNEDSAHVFANTQAMYESIKEI